MSMSDSLLCMCVCMCAVLDSHPLLAAFQVMLFEHIIMCRLITGNKTAAIQEANISLLSCYINAFVYRAVLSHSGDLNKISAV